MCWCGPSRAIARPSVVTDEASERLLADRNTSRAHNQFWNDIGNSYALVKGEYRTSWIVEPADGHDPVVARPGGGQACGRGRSRGPRGGRSRSGA